ncbi:unnamed protein product [Ranitomeya imitator]|uniref:Alpha-1,4-N-acetylglucosaminyltransferase n=1 Tax=Ranitomeya imitator TaxID=111125 RepID=A0ABN9MJR5_9NEOB|nr:unnamed protein product [Ranitomeya imitator]
MGFTFRKAKRKPSLTPKQKKTRLQWATEKQSWTVDDWMKVLFSDESRICIGRGADAGTFVWCRSNEIYKDDCLKKTYKTYKFQQVHLEKEQRNARRWRRYTGPALHLGMGQVFNPVNGWEMITTISSTKASSVKENTLLETISTSSSTAENIAPRSPSEILKEGNGIIYLETTDRMQPPPLVLCAIESAARLNSTNIEETVQRHFPVLSSLRNIYFFPLKMEELFIDTPLHSWYQKLTGLRGEPFLCCVVSIEGRCQTIKRRWFGGLGLVLTGLRGGPFLCCVVSIEGRCQTIKRRWFGGLGLVIDLQKQSHWTHVSSDACRLALIWKYGGMYMDTDIISIRVIPSEDFLAAQSSQFSSNGIFGFSTHHNFTQQCMEDFVRN